MDNNTKKREIEKNGKKGKQTIMQEKRKQKTKPKNKKRKYTTI